MTQDVLALRYSVRGRYQRAARIDLDLNDDEPLAGYVLHATAWDILQRFFLQATETTQRAFTWTGPNGGGKSSLALFLASLVGPVAVRRDRAVTLLGDARRAEFESLVQIEKGWIVVPVLGRREAPSSSAFFH